MKIRRKTLEYTKKVIGTVSAIGAATILSDTVDNNVEDHDHSSIIRITIAAGTCVMWSMLGKAVDKYVGQYIDELIEDFDVEIIGNIDPEEKA